MTGKLSRVEKMEQAFLQKWDAPDELSQDSDKPKRKKKKKYSGIQYEENSNICAGKTEELDGSGEVKKKKKKRSRQKECENSQNMYLIEEEETDKEQKSEENLEKRKVLQTGVGGYTNFHNGLGHNLSKNEFLGDVEQSNYQNAQVVDSSSCTKEKRREYETYLTDSNMTEESSNTDIKNEIKLKKKKHKYVERENSQIKITETEGTLSKKKKMRKVE